MLHTQTFPNKTKDVLGRKSGDTIQSDHNTFMCSRCSRVRCAGDGMSVSQRTDTRTEINYALRLLEVIALAWIILVSKRIAIMRV